MDDNEFMPLATHHLPDDASLPSPIQPHLDTLFAEFARTRPRISPPPSPSLRSPRHNRIKSVDKPSADLDLRALDYVTEYDSHLMCPICHVPFVEPVVLECDHTFCNSCLKEYREGASAGMRSQCPSCRTFLLSAPRKASRLIVNMCNEIRVRCPNDDCEEIVTRACIERHATKECEHERLKCPDTECGQLVKRKNYVPNQCIHTSHIECDCGAVIELGRGEWLRHKDEDCPNTGVICKECGQRIPARDYLDVTKAHICNSEEQNTCPGTRYGCTDEVQPDEVSEHVKSCPMARLAPFLQRQSKLLQSLQEQLTMVKVRNEVLETGFDKLNDIVNDRVLPYLNQSDHSPAGEASDIEEIERDHIPSAVSQRDLLMPAHLRDMAPSPDPDAASISQTQQHLLSLHESLRGNVSSLEQGIAALNNNISDLDARTSMQIMNETLRIKEDLAHTNAALFSTRAQVQWLLNRERIGQQQQAMRGRAPSAQPRPSNPGQSTRSSISEGNEVSNLGTSLESHASSSSAAPSPNFRPQIRRLSGGSQERVKL
ncbi:hypothetical protein LTR99_004576 [Exophiala xenobiotica]|uniref:Uncharacterized protein n=1 Tax=Vermiconidia calcicola TaxID=1690605 RepID=A0AAV9QCC4_9PEZI|nr:hypothetical protein LTR99_004576 [Exophiala xenobiotica]KAK5338730.1 hypothetical protein LTR98_005130 [Exophiala xenobiotica]KAK5432812.1 hypothetical protein LTR34_004285 [Exophiala xenobiotica]KAK5539856.1 hypothetical protein LTR25_003561 [Vermiconidia calcicola]KAK5547024.1 hypothetical protein LTR23_003027 [Chaetothyriales sp. CCFEE 6169]